MTIYFSASQNGFYDSHIHGERVPADAIKISPRFHAELLDGQSKGKRITAVNGQPTLISPNPSPDELARTARAKRDRLLVLSDWVVIRSSEMGVPVPDAWLNYREELRDITIKDGFPVNINWPKEPSS